MSCVELSLQHPAEPGQYRVFNHCVETFPLNELGRMFQEAGRDLGLWVEIRQIPISRLEAEKHYYNPAHTGLMSLG
jgi:UDP-sulfoquinovose synthase